MNREFQNMISIFEAMSDGVYLIDQAFTIQYMNPAMIREFGDGIGKKCHQVLRDDEAVCAWCKADAVFQGEAFHHVVHMPRVDKYYDVINLPLKAEDGTLSKLSIYRDITEARHREQRLKETEQNYRRLFEHVGCGVYISSKEGKFLDANQAALIMLGYSTKEEFLQIDIARDLYFSPDDRKKFQALVEEDDQVIEYEVDFKTRDGERKPVLLTAHVRYGPGGQVLGYEGIFVDQSQREQMESEIREVNAFLNRIIEGSPNAILSADTNGNIILWNHAAEEILGYSTEEALGGLTVQDIYPDGMARKVMQLLRSPEHHRPGMIQAHPIIYIRKDGQMAEGNLSAAILFDDRGKEIATVGVFVDLKERLDMERRLRQTQEQLLQAEKLAAMGRLTSQIAHELNNPLYGIMNTLELLKTEIPPKNRRRKILEMALSETIRLSDLLRKMLTFSKPDQQERQGVDINVVLDEILLLHEKQLREKDIQITTEFAAAPLVVNASKDQLRQVFLNLIANARDAMANGGTLTVETRRDGEEIHAVVTDTGYGIREENYAKIFDAFFTTKESVKGVGLGLSVCYGFIKDHGGDIRVASDVGVGTSFTVVLPIAHTENG